MHVWASVCVIAIVEYVQNLEMEVAKNENKYAYFFSVRNYAEN